LGCHASGLAAEKALTAFFERLHWILITIKVECGYDRYTSIQSILTKELFKLLNINFLNVYD
jgi:hypothetical protein